MKKLYLVMLVLSVTNSFTQELEMTDVQTWTTYYMLHKEPATALALSSFLPSAGHAYAGNWEKGLLFLGGEIGCLVVASIKVKPGLLTDQPGIGILVISAFGLRIWELVDAYKEAGRYNNNLYKRLYNQELPDFDLSVIPTQNGAVVNLAYRF